MKKFALFGLAAMTILLGACSNVDEPDPNGDNNNGDDNTGYVEPAGTGTYDDPMNVSAALVHAMDSSEVWVKGFIVGQVAGSDISAESQFEVPFTGAVYDDGTVATSGTNLLVAAKASESSSSACLVVQLPSGELRNQLNLVNNPDNDSKEVMLKGQLIKYFGVAGMKNTSEAILDGTPVGGSDTPDTPGTGDANGNGTKSNPFNVAGVVAQNNSGNTAWVKAYIVGQVCGMNLSSDAEFDTPFNVAEGSTQGTNVLIADNANESNTAACAIVQLPWGDIRDALNLPDNPTLDGKEVLLYGSLEKYFGANGVKNVSCAIVNSTTYGTDPGEGGTPDGTLLLSETFLNGLGDFTAYSVSGEGAWESSSSYGAVMSGYYNSQSNANEDWLISPALDFSGMSAGTISFDHAINKGDVANLKTNHTLWMSDNYNGGDPNAATWTQVEITTYPTGNSWTYVGSGDCAVPSQYIKAGVRFAFKYLCSDSESASWEIKNLKVYGE